MGGRACQAAEGGKPVSLQQQSRGRQTLNRKWDCTTLATYFLQQGPPPQGSTKIPNSPTSQAQLTGPSSLDLQQKLSVYHTTKGPERGWLSFLRSIIFYGWHSKELRTAAGVNPVCSPCDPSHGAPAARFGSKHLDSLSHPTALVPNLYVAMLSGFYGKRAFVGIYRTIKLQLLLKPENSKAGTFQRSLRGPGAF